MNFDHTQAYNYAKQYNLALLQQPLEEFDQLAKALSMTQAQVDMVMHQHLKQVLYVLTPQHYSGLVRIKLAFWFLFGRRN